ncbi:cytochrome c oxidase assembly protein [Goekera deserti]|uniref:Cytochrome c oxidase assembly protein n=1 Tax=Goekera deserti TaxID=2497753 RepID=A0A7K3WJT2_9ACTN|nr:cytochrome c oxidase assembly protein [Goekera deserti]NDI47309.1 cytochrome c oxidase assembly protein [Goekera deserti]NEL56139.1 cytochrome c oxidase assembly protein [Goekera deserti]
MSPTLGWSALDGDRVPLHLASWPDVASVAADRGAGTHAAHPAGHVTAAAGWVLPALVLLLPLVLYGTGCARLAGRGARWPVGRPAAWSAGLACAAAALSPPATAAAGQFPGHVLQHLLLTMAAPLLLSRAAPVTLALRTLPPAPRRLLLRMLHGRWARSLTRPAVVAVLAVAPLYPLYLTSAYASLHDHPLLHAAVHGHMVAAGLLVAWVLVGVDPVPGRPPVATRVVLLLVVAAGHDVLARLVYARADTGLLGDPDAVRAGALLLSYGSAVLEGLLVVVLMADWYRAGGRALRHERRRAAAGGPAAVTRPPLPGSGPGGGSEAGVDVAGTPADGPAGVLPGGPGGRPVAADGSPGTAVGATRTRS